MTMDEFIAALAITIECERATSNPNMSSDDGWAAKHWKCILRCDDNEMVTYFSQGSAHTSAPTAAEVLDCLASDAMGSYDSFEDWADGLGYDPDSRKAERIYTAIAEQTEQLREWLPSKADYLTLVHEIERL